MVDEKKPNEEEELVIVEEDESSQPPPDSEEKETPPPDKSGESDEDEDDEDEEGRLGASDDDDDPARGSRRDRKARRQRQKEARERTQRELRFLEKRNEQLERQMSELAKRVGSTEAATIDSRLAQFDAAIKKADSVIAEAIKEGKGEDAVEATRIRDDLRDRARQLREHKERMSQREEKEDDDDGAASEIDPRVLSNVKDWHKRNPWYDFGKRDADSRVVGAIDDSLIAEGFDPLTSEYYEELDERIAKYLPHRIKKEANGKDTDPPRREGKKPGAGGPKFRQSGRERTLKPNEVYISKERKEAMIELGVWDDPVLRKKYLKKYQDWDRANADQ